MRVRIQGVDVVARAMTVAALLVPCGFAADSPAAVSAAIPEGLPTRPMSSEGLAQLRASAPAAVRIERLAPLHKPAPFKPRVAPQLLTILAEQRAYIAKTPPHLMSKAQAQTAASASNAAAGSLAPVPLLAANAPTGLLANAPAVPAGMLTTQTPGPMPSTAMASVAMSSAATPSAALLSGPAARPATAVPGPAPAPLPAVSARSAAIASGGSARNIGVQTLPNATRCFQPTIVSVNGRADNVVFTPQAEDNAYVIRGCQLGNSGKAYLIGNFNAPQINLEIQYWSDNEIDARVDRNIGGELDRDGIALVLAPGNAPELKATGFHFIAARSDPAVLLPSLPSSWSQNSPASPLYSSPVTPNGTDIPSAAAGMTVYVARANQSNANGNVDIFTFNNLAPGWTTDSAQLDSYDISHCPGTVTYRKSISSYQVSWTEENNLLVNSAYTTCSGFILEPPPPFPPVYAHTYSNLTASAYSLDVWVRGPRCTDPFSGAPLVSCQQNLRTCGKEQCGS
jgi:hypothetical protein